MLTVSQQGSHSGFTLVSLLILEGGCDQNKDCHFQQATGATGTLGISILSCFASSKHWGEMSYSPWSSSEANEII